MRYNAKIEINNKGHVRVVTVYDNKDYLAVLDDNNRWMEFAEDYNWTKTRTIKHFKDKAMRDAGKKRYFITVQCRDCNPPEIDCRKDSVLKELLDKIDTSDADIQYLNPIDYIDLKKPKKKARKPKKSISPNQQSLL